MNSTDSKPKSKAEREAEEKARRRAEEATIVAGLKQAINADEQLLGFARGRVAGGIRGKMSLGPEAFFAPFVNIGLTERRLVIQHINAETGRPGEILPHFYALGDIASLAFSDIETFGGESAARLTLRLRNDQHTRLRLRGQSSFENAQAIVEVFRSLTLAQRPKTTPTQRVCAACQHILDQPFKFCPYCGQLQDLSAEASAPPPAATAEPEPVYPPTPPGATEPEFLDTVPYQNASVFRGPTVEDGLDFLTPDLPSEPSAPEEPTAPSEPSEPTKPSEPVEPTEPAEPIEPSEPVEPEGATTAPPVEDAAFETPSEFEGWSVDPGATTAVIDPAEEVEQTSPLQSFAEAPVAPPEPVIETEASVAEPMPETVFVPTASSDSIENQTDVHITEELHPTIHPEAEFAPIPETVAFTPAEADAPMMFEPAAIEPKPAHHPDFASEPPLNPDIAVPPQAVWSPQPLESPVAAEVAPVAEANVAASSESQDPPASESFAETAPVAVEHVGSATPEHPVTAPSHDDGGFVSGPVVLDSPPVVPTFEPLAPIVPVPEVSEADFASKIAEPTVASVPSDPAPIVLPEAESTPTPESVPPSPPAAAENERFAALLREVRGSDAPDEAAPKPPVVERRDGPMSVNVHINRPPVVVNETFTGRNADEIVGKLKARVSSEVNFAMRMMINSYNNLRFAQEVVRRYNDQEKTHYPLPNSCWEFLQNAEDINYVTISLDN